MPLEPLTIRKDKDGKSFVYHEGKRWPYIEPPIYDWVITEKNYGKEGEGTWHEIFFTPLEVKLHQAKGNCNLARRIIEYMEEQEWLKRGDVILDPMCGIASFLRVTALMGYDGIGVELEEKFCNAMFGYEDVNLQDEDENGQIDMLAGYSHHVQGGLEKFRQNTRNIKRLGNIDVYNEDARNLVELCNKKLWYFFHARGNVICSPPYMAATEQTDEQAATVSGYTGHKSHGYTDPNSIARLDDAPYMKEMLKVYKQLYKVLPIGAHVALITRDCIKEFTIVGLWQITVNLMQAAGFDFIERKTAQLPDVSFLKRNNWRKHFRIRGLPLIDWEDVTFYEKAR